MDSKKIGIVGSGLIGRSWAMIFASAGYNVTIYDIEPSQSFATGHGGSGVHSILYNYEDHSRETRKAVSVGKRVLYVQVSNALKLIKTQLEELAESDMLRGTLSVEAQFALIKGSNSMEEALAGASFVQECVFEKLEVKQKVFSEMEQYVSDGTILSSSSSCIMPSKFTEHLKRRNQCIISHPINPPYYAPLVEIIPAPWTDQSVVDRTRAVIESVGQTPVTLKKEVPGFAVNRIQYAIIAEVWRLVEEGVLSVDDVDKVMSAGLGLRYAFMGPLEVMHLNAEGMQSYMERYTQSVRHVLSDFGPTPTFTGNGLEHIIKEMEAKIPLDKLEERRQWRDTRLAALAKLKRDLEREGK